jgi:hypothetical protein
MIRSNHETAPVAKRKPQYSRGETRNFRFQDWTHADVSGHQIARRDVLDGLLSSITHGNHRAIRQALVIVRACREAHQLGAEISIP